MVGYAPIICCLPLGAQAQLRPFAEGPQQIWESVQMYRRRPSLIESRAEDTPPNQQLINRNSCLSRAPVAVNCELCKLGLKLLGCELHRTTTPWMVTTHYHMELFHKLA